MVDDSQIEQFIENALSEIRSIDKRCQEVQEKLDRSGFSMDNVSKEERQIAEKLVEEKKKQVEVESLNRNYALSQQNSAATTSISRHARRRNMV